ncbi:2'-5' RNA ligase family protein [Streptomyces chrestomyceticus]|uniref:2'-5' RNA ligase family protein n=1 Tax=Streptomyces chrestomyceticus TaxID=68185 RepID=UPI003674DF4F
MAPELAVDAEVFPCAPPADLDDGRVIAEHDWQAFRAVERMSDHWDRPGWRDGQRAYYWMLTFPNATPQLLQYTARCQSSLHHLGMDPVPHDGLHVTVSRIGSTDQVPAVQLHRLIALAQELRIHAFRVDAHPLAGSPGAVRFSLAPWRPLIRLHRCLSALGSRAAVPGGRPTSSFRPHLGVAYSNRRRSAAPVIQAVAPLRALPPVPLDITSVELVALRREGRAYRWETLYSLALPPQEPAGAGTSG